MLFRGLLLGTVKKLIFLFVKIKVGIVYDIIFVKIEILIAIKMVMLEDRFWYSFK